MDQGSQFDIVQEWQFAAEYPVGHEGKLIVPLLYWKNLNKLTLNRKEAIFNRMQARSISAQAG